MICSGRAKPAPRRSSNPSQEATIFGQDKHDFLPDDEPVPERDPASRYHHGMDRWDPDAFGGHEVCHSSANCRSVAQDRRGAVWWWSHDDQLWFKLDVLTAKLVVAENDLFVVRMRKALPLIRSFSEAVALDDEDAAYALLSTLSLEVNSAYRRSPDDGDTIITASDLYSGVTRDQAWQIPDLCPPAYDQAVADHLRKRDRDLRTAISEEATALRKTRKPPGSTLGDRLRPLEADRAEKEARENQRDATRLYFEEVKEAIAGSIGLNKIPSTIIVPLEHDAAFGLEPNCDLFDEFCEWAASEGLAVLCGASDFGQGPQVELAVTAKAHSPFALYSLPAAVRTIS